MPFVLALWLVVTPLAYGQTPEKKPGPAPASKSADASVEQTLTKIEHDATAAILKRDFATFGKFLADDAVITTPDGSMRTKAQVLAELKSGDLVLESSAISDLKVRAFGDAAVVTYITTDKGTYKKQDISGRFRWTDVFVRRGGNWLIVASHGTPIQTPPK